MADTASYANAMSMLTYTDINGNFSDATDLYDSVGVVFAYADNNCNNTELPTSLRSPIFRTQPAFNGVLQHH